MPEPPQTNPSGHWELNSQAQMSGLSRRHSAGCKFLHKPEEKLHVWSDWQSASTTHWVALAMPGPVFVEGPHAVKSAKTIVVISNFELRVMAIPRVDGALHTTPPLGGG